MEVFALLHNKYIKEYYCYKETELIGIYSTEERAHAAGEMVEDSQGDKLRSYKTITKEERSSGNYEAYEIKRVDVNTLPRGTQSRKGF